MPMTPVDALARFDALAPVSVDFMLGDWTGAEVPTGHPMDGLLSASRWHGKRFTDADTVYPLVHTTARGRRYCVHPRRMPLGLILASPALKRMVAPWMMDALRPLTATTQPTARLRAVSHRGTVSAAMVYDHLPIIDHFRMVDDDNVMGLMDYRGWPPYFFSLSRSGPAPSR